MQKLDIIVGTSHFNGGPVVGIALKGDTNASACCKWAESVATTAWGRPIGVEPKNGRKTTEAEEIAYLANRWQEWATHNNIQITINRTPRRVKKPF